MKLGIYNHLHNILRLFDVLPNFSSPRVKRYATISYKHGIYHLPHVLPNDLSFRILGNNQKNLDETLCLD